MCGKYLAQIINPVWNQVGSVRFQELTESVLAGVAQWIECWPANQRGTGWIPSQSTFLGCGPGPH